MKKFESFKTDAKHEYGYFNPIAIKRKVITYLKSQFKEFPAKLKSKYTEKLGQIFIHPRNKKLNIRESHYFQWVDKNNYDEAVNFVQSVIDAKDVKDVKLYVRVRAKLFDNIKNSKTYRISDVIIDSDGTKGNDLSTYYLSDSDIDQLDKKLYELWDRYEFDYKGIDNILHVEELKLNGGLRDVKNKHKELGYKFLESLNGVKEVEFNDTECVLRFIVKELNGKRRFKKFDMTLLKQQLKEMRIMYWNGMSTNDLEDWIKAYYPNYISFHAINPLCQVFHSYIASDHIHSLMFVVNNSHVYPLTNETIKHSICKSKRIVSEEVKFQMVSENYQLLNVEEKDDNITWNDMIKNIEDKSKVLLIDGFIDEIAQNVIEQTGYMITAFKITNGQIMGFQHPETQQIIEVAENYDVRKEICDKLYEKYPFECFKFKNQSFAGMGKSIQDIICGQIPKSYQMDEDRDIVDYYMTKPLIKTLVENHNYNKKTCQGNDIIKSYTNAVLNMEDDYYVFSICDSFKKYEDDEIFPGDYLVDNFSIEQIGGVFIEKQILPYNTIKYLLNNEFMDKSKILSVNKASYTLDKSKLANVMKELRILFPEPKIIQVPDIYDQDKLVDVYETDYYKIIGNCLIGSLGKRFDTTDNGFITNSYETVCASFFDATENGLDFNVNMVNDLYFTRIKNKTRIYGDHSQIYRQILGQGMIQLFDLLKEVYQPGKSKLIGYNTDSVFIEYPKTRNIDTTKYRLEKWKPKKYVPIEEDTDIIELEPLNDWNTLKDVTFNDDKILIDGVESDDAGEYLETLVNKSFVCIGGGGCQKSTLASKINDNCVVLCYSNKACDSFRKKINHKNVFTFDSYFSENGKMDAKILKIQVDEFSMLPVSWITTLYKLKKHNPKLVIQMFGDPNQCKQVCKNKRYFEYLNKKVFRFICGNNIMKKVFVPGCARYDEELYKVLNEVQLTGKLPKELKNKPIDEDLTENIVRMNDERDLINDLFAENWTIGMRVIAETNIKPKEIYNSTFYYIHEILNDMVIVKDESGKILQPVGKSHFRPSFACTVYKYQGSEIINDVNIRQTHLMDLNELYTALSRCKKLSQIRINWTDRKFYPAHEPIKPTEIKCDQIQLGYIYIMINETSKVRYIGFTTSTIEKRFKEHLENKLDVIHKHNGKWTIKNLSNVYYFSIKTLQRIETNYIRLYKTNKDYKLINTQKIAKEEIKTDIKIGNVDTAIKANYKFKIEQGNVDTAIQANHKFKIEEGKNFFRIRYRANGQNILVKRSFGPKISKEKAFESINKIASEIVL